MKCTTPLRKVLPALGFSFRRFVTGSSPRRIRLLLQQLDLASNLVRHSHGEARRSIAMLRPESLDSQDILSALEGVCASAWWKVVRFKLSRSAKATRGRFP